MHSPAKESGRLTPRPEQTFFTDPALDRAMGVVMALASEVYVLRDRLGAIEQQLCESGALDRVRLAAAPSATEVASKVADRDDFVTHIMYSVLGSQMSKGASA